MNDKEFRQAVEEERGLRKPKPGMRKIRIGVWVLVIIAPLVPFVSYGLGYVSWEACEPALGFWTLLALFFGISEIHRWFKKRVRR